MIDTNSSPTESDAKTTEPAAGVGEAAAGASASAAAGKPTISYDDFAKLDITIGTITAVEIVEQADKLLKLTVEVGEDAPRQIISGIREYFADPQELVGKQCPFLTNLAPRTIRGFESQGMILAANDSETFALLTPHQSLTTGTKVK